MMDIARGVEHPHRVEPRQDRTASENNLIVRLKRAEEALRTRELNFQLVVDSIPAPVAVTSPAGEIEGVNQPALEYLDKTLARQGLITAVSSGRR
jgi:PAS domain-containing protein